MDMRLSSDFTFAERANGERVRFTRSEKRALEVLCQNPNRILTRDQILDALSGAGSEKGDRNIDFLINRLRRKLSDDARNPRYIATRYGEGYAWIGGAPGVATDLADAYLVVGPLRGLDNLGGDRRLAERFAADLRTCLSADLKPGQTAALAPDCPPATDFAERMPNLSIELLFFDEGGTTHCVATARQFRSGRILALHRLTLPATPLIAVTRSATEVASQILTDAWRSLASDTESGVPLPVLIHLADKGVEAPNVASTTSDQKLKALTKHLENRSMEDWKKNDARLRSLLEANPEDAAIRIMHATHIHSKYVSFGHRLFKAGIDDRAEDEDLIETLVLAALPDVQAAPDYAIMAAKLLHFLDRGYSDLAQSLSENAYHSSVSAVSSLAIVGQLRAFAGHTDAALKCLDQALNLVTPGSQAHFYVLTIKIQTLRALADFDRLNAAKQELYSHSTATMFFYEPLMADPANLSLRARTMVRMLSRERAMALLTYNNYVSARLYRDPEHRENALLTLLTLFSRRFGVGDVPEEVARAHPRLIDLLF